MQKKHILKGIIFLSFFLLAGCALFSVPQVAFEQAGNSPSGLTFEQVLPDNTFLLAEINLLNVEQKKLFDKLKKNFPQKEEEKTFEKKLIETFNEQIKSYGLDYEKDIKPLLADKERYVVAIAPGEAKDVNNYVSAILKDPVKFDEVLVKVSKSGNEKITLEEYKNQKILTDRESGLFITRSKDLAIAGKGLWAAKEMIDRAESQKNILGKNDSFKRAVENLPTDRLAFFYLNLGQMLKNMEALGAAQSLSALPNQELGKITDLESLVFTADNNGLKFFGQYIAKSDSPYNYNDFGGKNYLYKEIPADQLLLYFEGAKLNKIIETTLKTEAKTGEITRYEQVKQALQKYNIDLEKDISTWLDKGFAVSLHDNKDQYIPGISLLIDASGDPKKAQDLLRIVDAQITGLFLMLKETQSAELTDVIEQKDIDMGGAKLKALIVNLDKFSQMKGQNGEQNSPAVIEAFKNQKLQIIYGVTKDNRFIISTYQGLESFYGKGGLDGNKEYAKIVDNLNGNNEGLIFLDSQKTIAYADKLVQLLTAIQQSPSMEEMIASYNEIKAYLNPIKSIIFSYQLDKKTSTSRGFIRIGE